MIEIFDMQVRELVLKPTQREVVVCRVEIEELVEQMQQFFHFPFLPDQSNLFLGVRVV